MKRTETSRAPWAPHVLLALTTLVWLCVAEYVVSFPTFVTVGVAAGITLSGGIVTSVVADKLVQAHRRKLRAHAKLASQRAVELRQLINQLPTFQALFEVLFPQTSRSEFASHEFAEWLEWAYCGPHTNLREWTIAYVETAGLHVPELAGLFGHVSQPHLEEMMYSATGVAVGTSTMIRLRQCTTPTSEQSSKVAQDEERVVSTADVDQQVPATT